MAYQFNTPERYIDRLSKSIPFGLANEGWNDIVATARREVQCPTFEPTRFWVVVDDESPAKKGLVLQEKTDGTTTTCVLDITRTTFTHIQVNLLELMHLMTTPEYSID